MQFSRKPVRKVLVYRDQWVMGIRQMVPVYAWEYDDGTLLTGAERCQHIISGSLEDGTIVRCKRKAWYESKRYHHTLCEKHKEN